MKPKMFRHNQIHHPQGQTSAIFALLLIASLAILVLPEIEPSAYPVGIQPFEWQ